MASSSSSRKAHDRCPQPPPARRPRHDPAFTALASEDADRKEVARLDTEDQAAVKRNDAEGMGRVLHERFILVLATERPSTGRS